MKNPRYNKTHIHIRINGWKIGDYDTFTSRDGCIIVGQLCHINEETCVGTFRGFVLNDITGQSRELQARDWKHNLWSSEPTRVSSRYISEYEKFLNCKPKG